MVALIRQSMTVWTCLPDVPVEQRSLARGMLQSIGEEIFVEKEDYIDIATAISGTGPAYFLMVMESLIDAGLIVYALVLIFV